MRHWNRSADHLGNKALNDLVQRELSRRFSPEQYPANIDVLGSHGDPLVHITNYNAGIDLREKAHPEDFHESGGTLAAVIAMAEHMIADLEESGKLDLIRYAKR